jgi:hypothetical protein
MWTICFILFFILANPATFRLTRKLYSGISSSEGLATQVGVLVHALVYVVIAHSRQVNYEQEYPQGW